MRITEIVAEINEILFTVSGCLSEFAIGPQLLNGTPPPYPQPHKKRINGVFDEQNDL